MYNKVFLIGNLTRDPDLRYTTSGIPVTRFAVAVNRGKNKEDVDFINIVAWRRLAEICGEFLKKGRPVAVEGRLQIRSYTARDGQKKTMTEVIADNMQMLGSRPSSVTSQPSTEDNRQKTDDGRQLTEESIQPPEDEIPF